MKMNGEVKVEIETVNSCCIDTQGTEYSKQSTKDCIAKPRSCNACGKPIVDQYLLKILEQYWHEQCLKCFVCGSQLSDACFNKEEKLYCKEDYRRLYGCKCSGCDLLISPNELVMKALQNVYHVDCFKCDECGDKLEKGDEFILKEDKLYCSADFNVAENTTDIDVFSSDDNESMSTTSTTSPNCDDKNNGTPNSCKRPRTILTSQQREDFKAAFEQTPKPCRKVREQLSNETGLSVRVVQVWFQNQRAKLKKIQKKAEEGGGTNKIKRVNNQGKITKKKRNKSISSSKSSESSSPSDFNLPISANITPHYPSLLDITENYASANIYYGGGTHESLTSNNNNNNQTGLLAQTNTNFTLRSTFYPYARFQSSNMEQTGGVNSIHSHYGDGFQLPTVNNDLASQPPVSTTSHFQLMPHLMNSFI